MRLTKLSITVFLSLVGTGRANDDGGDAFSRGSRTSILYITSVHGQEDDVG